MFHIHAVRANWKQLRCIGRPYYRGDYGCTRDPRRFYGSSCTVEKFSAGKKITVWFRVWEWRLELLWSNSGAKKLISPLTLTLYHELEPRIISIPKVLDRDVSSAIVSSTSRRWHIVFPMPPLSTGIVPLLSFSSQLLCSLVAQHFCMTWIIYCVQVLARLLVNLIKVKGMSPQTWEAFIFFSTNSVLTH